MPESPERVYFRSTPHPVTVTTRIITFLVGNPYKPSFPTVTGWGVDLRSTIVGFRMTPSKSKSYTSTVNSDRRMEPSDEFGIFALHIYHTNQPNVGKYTTLGIQSYSQIMIGVSNHLLSIVFWCHYHSQKVIGFLGPYMDPSWELPNSYQKNAGPWKMYLTVQKFYGYLGYSKFHGEFPDV